MSTAHTPGPWRALRPDGGFQAARDLWELAQRHPLRSHYWFIQGPGDDVHGHMSEDDARLIAAAPELLSALIALVAAADDAYTVRTEDNRVITHPAVAEALDAIARATGGQP